MNIKALLAVALALLPGAFIGIELPSGRPPLSRREPEQQQSTYG